MKKKLFDVVAIRSVYASAIVEAATKEEAEDLADEVEFEDGAEMDFIVVEINEVTEKAEPAERA